MEFKVGPVEKEQNCDSMVRRWVLKVQFNFLFQRTENELTWLRCIPKQIVFRAVNAVHESGVLSWKSAAIFFSKEGLEKGGR